MNPILASNLLNVGSNLMNRILPPSTPAETGPGAVSFEAKLENAQENRALPINLEKLKNEILENPDIQSFLSSNPNCEITLDQMSDGSMRILSSSGDFMTLNSGTSLCTKVSQYFQSSIDSGEHLSADRAHAVVLIG